MKILLYIGRFQPFHNGHKLLVQDALKRCERLVIGLGSANARASPKNPFSLNEREEMIRASVDASGRYIPIIHLYDFPKEDDYWATQVRREMARFDRDWGIYGYDKDSSSFYLNLFPGHPLTIYDGSVLKVNATDIRKQFFRNNPDMTAIKQQVPNGTFEVLSRIQQSERWELACQGAYL